jgi:hypothetical protein
MRKVSQILGLLAGSLTMLGAIPAWLVPQGSSEGQFCYGPVGQLVTCRKWSHSTSLAQFLGGTDRALAIVSTLAILGFWLLLASWLDIRRQAPRGMLWTGAIVLAIAAFLATPLFIYLFWLPGLLGLMAATLRSLGDLAPS